MNVRTLVRWATLFALIMAPLAVSADPDKDKTSDEATADKPRTPTAKVKLTDAETQALAHFHHVNQTEIDMGKLAQKQGSRAAIKTYGQSLVKDHTANDQKLTALAKKNNVVIQKDLAINEDDQQQMKDSMDAMNKLRATKGPDFDRDFLQMMVKDHERELGKIDTAIGQANNADLVAILKATKPVVQKHADRARDLMKTNAQATR